MHQVFTSKSRCRKMMFSTNICHKVDFQQMRHITLYRLNSLCRMLALMIPSVLKYNHYYAIYYTKTACYKVKNNLWACDIQLSVQRDMIWCSREVLMCSPTTLYLYYLHSTLSTYPSHRVSAAAEYFHKHVLKYPTGDKRTEEPAPQRLPSLSRLSVKFIVKKVKLIIKQLKWPKSRVSLLFMMKTIHVTGVDKLQ